MSALSPLVFSTVALVDPALTGWSRSRSRGFPQPSFTCTVLSICLFLLSHIGIMSWIFGLERLPDMRVWLGGAIVMAGVGFITVGEAQREVPACPASIPCPSDDTDSLGLANDPCSTVGLEMVDCEKAL
jgi:hypothetical protein